jgi:hypothetical protein
LYPIPETSAGPPRIFTNESYLPPLMNIIYFFIFLFLFFLFLGFLFYQLKWFLAGSPVFLIPQEFLLPYKQIQIWCVNSNPTLSRVETQADRAHLVTNRVVDKMKETMKPNFWRPSQTHWNRDFDSEAEILFVKFLLVQIIISH